MFQLDKHTEYFNSYLYFEKQLGSFKKSIQPIKAKKLKKLPTHSTYLNKIATQIWDILFGCKYDNMKQMVGMLNLLNNTKSVLLC